MGLITLSLPDELSERLHRLAHATACSEADLIAHALADYLDEIEEARLAAETLARLQHGQEQTHPAAAVRQRLGLAD